MSTSFTPAPHHQGPQTHARPSEAPNAALLVDFDNVTMGMRSDLSKELKTLLNSDIIRGKVTVQRAYADWRRYPQYIVPLSEASIDLIFAPAYGSSKKNATDIRMAIDGMELVFTRPEIGTYILLTGDSDFSSLVLKLKEYGKYVIGVGIQESSSDILVQNCDEYYSYTSISGLSKSTDAGPSPSDPWVLVEKAVERMSKRKDVMRSDRLKQVMLELDAGFDEKSLGFSKFSRFLTEAAQKGVLQLRKLENGQYEIQAGAAKGAPAASPAPSRSTTRAAPAPSRSRDRRASGRDGERKKPSQPTAPPPGPPDAPAPSVRPEALEPAYQLLRRSLADLLEDQDSDSVRDSDVKRRMLALESGFDEAELGFGKFSRFLRHAHDHEVITLRKGEEGNYHVSLGAGPRGRAAPSEPDAPAPPDRSRPAGDPPMKAPDRRERTERTERAREPAAGQPGGREPGGRHAAAQPDGERVDAGARRLRPRTASPRRGQEEPPPIFEGQVVGSPRGRSGAEAPGASAPGGAASPPAGADGPGAEVFDPEDLRLPTDRKSIIKYLSNSYGGVGEKTAESVVDTLGPDLFRVLQTRPSRVEEIVPPARAEKLLEGWRADFARRKERYLTERDAAEETRAPQANQVADAPATESEYRRRGRRTRGGGPGAS